MSYAFRVDYRDVAPTAASWSNADLLARREFQRLVIKLVLKAKDKELAAGLDRHGAPLAPIAASTRRNRRSAMGHADPNAPPLTPAYALSRTRSLLDGRAETDAALFFWRKDPISGKPWGVILGYHRQGSGRLPVRDVIGLSPQSLAWVKLQIADWWEARERGRLFYETGFNFYLATPSANGMARPRPPVRPRYRIVAAPAYVHATAHTSRPAEANAPMKPGDFVSGFGQIKRLRRK